MSRPKKDGERVSLFLNREMMERLRVYADDKGQTLTMAIERIITGFLNEEDKRKESE